MTSAIVILTWNNQAYLERFLPILIKNTPSEESDIIIADNASTDGTLSWMQSNFPNIKVLAFENNLGYAGGYKKALSLLDYDVFICMNSDIEVREGWLKPILTRLENNPNIGACMPKIKAINDRNRFEYAGAAGGMITRLGFPFCRGRMVNRTEVDHGQYNDIVPLFWASGACFAVKSEAYRQAGGFDERFFAHMEEIDLCWRMKICGWNIICESSSEVYHIGGGTLSVKNPRKTFYNFRNSLYMLYKNLHPSDFRFIFPMRLIVDGLLGIRFLLRAEFSMFKAVIDAHLSFYRTSKGMRKKDQPRLKLKDLTGIELWLPHL